MQFPEILASILPDSLKDWLTLIVATLWLVYLWRENFGRKPSLAEELAELARVVESKASQKELAERCDRLEQETKAEVTRLREDAANRHLENRERLRRLEDQSTGNGNHIAKLEGKIEDLVASNHVLGTKLDRLIERLSTSTPTPKA